MFSSETNAKIANGSSDGHHEYSIPKETSQVFSNAILSNKLISKDLPNEIKAAARKVRFTGSSNPSIPVNWRFAEAVASLKGLEAALVNVLLKRKYNLDYQDVTISTDHATLFIMSAFLWTIDPGEGGLNVSPNRLREANAKMEIFFPSRDMHRSHATTHRSLATGIYQCADGRYYNLHGSMNPDPVLESIELPHDQDTKSFEEAVERFQKAVSKISSEEMDRRCNDEYRQAGTICYTADEFRSTEHGRANKDVGLWEIYDHLSTSQPPCWWPAISSTGANRPLAGLKVVDLTRVIAAPAVTRGMAELGASVIRCTSPNLPDVSSLHPDLNWGKWNCSIDLKKAEDREKLKNLILQADVVVQGYRPGALDKYGFSQQAIIDMCEDRERGIISVRENCYGWHGPWSHRSGWQQISDSSVGVALGFGKAMGHDEGVIPIFPHSDYCTGISGTCAIIIALLRRGEKGGSYAIDLALNYYTSWLVNEVGEYPRPVFEKVWDENGRKVWRSYHTNAISGPETMKTLRAGVGGERLFQDRFFEERNAPGILGDKKFRHMTSIAQWPTETVEAGFQIGTRGNGVDAARWPDDLCVERIV